VPKNVYWDRIITIYAVMMANCIPLKLSIFFTVVISSFSMLSGLAYSLTFLKNFQNLQLLRYFVLFHCSFISIQNKGPAIPVHNFNFISLLITVSESRRNRYHVIDFNWSTFVKLCTITLTLRVSLPRNISTPSHHKTNRQRRKLTFEKSDLFKVAYSCREIDNKNDWAKYISATTVIGQ
jgi:hypothetical protein